VICERCGGENPAGQRFCGACGSALSQGCAACGAVNPAGQRFCGGCGAALGPAAVAAPAASAAPAEPTAERKLVSVLFADLVGFTTLSESRDAEEVRELLSRYFDACRRLIELYGGVVEKFIGDAVMAVWGTPAATEDDAERAVRAALDLVTAVSALGEEIGAEGLRARAGVLTGEAAVTLGAAGQGMVAGDLVNTASRIQSAAEPGTVLVGEATRRASERTIAYEDAGSHVLKGKEGETPLWRALRVVSGRQGSLKSHGLEAPFVGRDRELRQIKELFHDCADEKRARLVSVTGIAGIGKSRLGWEFYKYFDGIEQTIYWHRGRCLAYGEGVAYWALADMVRMRCGIAEDDEAPVALEKLRASLSEHLLDDGDRRFCEPRLAQLLGIGEHDAREQGDLFAAWRLFFERLAEVYPTILAFEDMQWADAALLDFVEHLLEWSRDSSLFVVTFARPELAERRPTWGAGQRNFTSLYLDRLPASAMQELLTGLVPGLPTSLRARILERAEGVPLYAVETVRMLLDRGLLVEDGPSYRVVGEVESLAIPETLQALAAARLDGLAAEERRIVQDAAVLGKTFSSASLGALAGIPAAELETLLAGLVRKEVFGLQLDPRSPEHGQYGFLQDLIRQVAYDTIAKRDRREKHLAAAQLLTQTLADDEVAEVVASHLLEAYRLDPDADGADELRARAQRALASAGERVAALGAAAEARRFFEQAAELAVDAEEQATSYGRAGEMASLAGENDDARRLFEEAQARFEQAGEAHAAARIASFLALLDQREGRIEAGLARLEPMYAAIAEDEPDADLALVIMRLSGGYIFSGQIERGLELIERGLDVAEALQLTEILVRGWTGKAIAVIARRPAEAMGLYRLALETALDHDLSLLAAGTAGNLSDLCFHRDRYSDSLGYLDQSLGLFRRMGSRVQEWFVLSEQSYALTMLGRWDEALARAADVPLDQQTDAQFSSVLTGALEIRLRRGELDQAAELLQRFEPFRDSSDLQATGGYHGGLAAVRVSDGRYREALAAAERSISACEVMGLGSQDVKQGMRHALEASLALGEPETVERLLAIVEEAPPGLRPPFLVALSQRFRARLAGELPEADRHFAAALAQFRALQLPFDEAVVSLEYAEWLERIGRTDEAAPLRESARAAFEHLRATPWLERAATGDAVPA
jgi:class 3 adenylate cyclase/tetratricopeptide (TPR) repeat protein